jgi:hypothetical protein
MPYGLWRRRSGRRPRRRLTGCLLWILAIIIVLVILSLFFGGFQKGTKAGGLGRPAPVPVAARVSVAPRVPVAAGPGGGR